MTSSILGIALSGLRTQQTGLTVTGHNITNVSTPGYSRQQAVISTSEPQFTGNGFMGTGATASGVRRVADEFLTKQVRVDTASFQEVDTYLASISRMDDFLADARTGLAPVLQSWFAALQGAANDPSSLPQRQLLLTQSQGLADRFHAVQQRVVEENANVNSALAVYTQEVNALANSVAELNAAIAGRVQGGIASQPNDLIDQRDEALRNLAELVGISTTAQDDGSVNVFIGQGQGLVLGTRVTTLSTQASTTDANQFDVVLNSTSGPVAISDLISGGKMGGALRYRSEVLAPTLNEVGRVALVMAEQVNEQHHLGMDLEGNLGQNFFNDINGAAAASARAIPDSRNAPPLDRILSVNIIDGTQLTASDYELTFPGPNIQNYVLRRVNDNVIVNQGELNGPLPQSIFADGFNVQLTSGSFQSGDRYLIQPVRRGAEFFDLAVQRPQELALAQPIRTAASRGNTGFGVVSAGEVLDTGLATFTTQAGAITPPMLVRFTSATTYDILDNSNPNNPVDLVPPQRERTFVPNSNNVIFGTDPGATLVSSTGALVGRVVAGLSNGYLAESYTFNLLSPAGVPTSTTVSTAANASAAQIAATLAGVPTVKAYANTELQLSNFTNAGGLTVSINGLLVSGTSANALATSINNNSILRNSNIRAYSDGSVLTLRADGDDVQVTVGGGAGDSVRVTDRFGGFLNVTGGSSATVGGVVDVELPQYASLTTSGNGVFTTSPAGTGLYTGYTVSISGTPAAGDVFTVGYNTSGTSDNRNALKLNALQTTKTVGAAQTLEDSYGSLIEDVGARTSQARIGQESGQSVLDASTRRRDNVSAVNLDEEAAKLIQFEQAYNATAQLVGVARTLFDTLLQATR